MAGLTSSVFCPLAAVLAVSFLIPGAFGQEVISDLTVSSTDERQALGIKRERFWKDLLLDVESMGVPDRLRLCADAEEEAARLPADQEYVRVALTESLTHLRRSNEALLAQAVQSRDVAMERLAATKGSGSDWNLHGGSARSLFDRAIRHFVGEGRYSERLKRDVADRQADILPVLRGTAAITGNVLSDCRLASKRGFDLLKYDIYNRGVPKTSKTAKDMADRLIDAAGQTRRQFMSIVMGAVGAVVNDAKGRDDGAVATVVQAGLEGANWQQSTEQLVIL